jgi:hypothetical protein
MEASTVATKTRSADDLIKKCVILKLTLNSIGNSKKVSVSQIESEADKTLLKVQKLLLDSPELRAIRKLDGETRRAMYSLCLPFEAGMHFLPLTLVERADERLKQVAEIRAALVETFVDNYETQRAQAERRLGPLYNENDYATPDEVRAAFDIQWNYITLEAPASLQNISSNIWEKEREKVAARMDQAYADITATMRAAMLELVDHLRERLTPSDDGSTKRLKSSTVKALQDWLSLFNFRNVTDDAELQALVGQVRESMSTVPDADALRDNDALRSRVLDSMTQASAQLQTLVNEGRKFKFAE